MMNIMLAGNDKVYYGIELVVYSTMAHNKNVHWYIVTMDYEQRHDNSVHVYIGLQDWQKEKLEKIVNYFDAKNSSIIFIDGKELYDTYLYGGVNEINGFTPYAAFRLIADILFPDLDHILYLDCDTAVTTNIEGIYANCL